MPQDTGIAWSKCSRYTDRDRRLYGVESYAVETPIEMIDELLIIAQCLPHDCGDQNVMIVIDPKQPRIWAGFFSRAQSLVSTRWYGPTDYRELPDAVLKLFDSRHTP
jgi:hypothetical protein